MNTAIALNKNDLYITCLCYTTTATNTPLGLVLNNTLRNSRQLSAADRRPSQEARLGKEAQEATDRLSADSLSGTLIDAGPAVRIGLEHRDGVAVVELRCARRRGQVVGGHVEEGHEGALLLVLLHGTGRHKGLELALPAVVVDLGHVVAVVAENREVLVHAKARVGCDMDDVNALVDARSASWDGVQGRGDSDGRDVADRHGVDGVDDVRAAGELDAALEHADQEVVVVDYARGGVAENVAGTDNGAEKAATAGFADKLLAHPLGLAVTRAETDTAAFHVVGLHDGALAGAGLLVRQVDVVVCVEDTGGADKRE